MKKKIFITTALFFCAVLSFAADNPSIPINPTVAGDNSGSTNAKSVNIEIQRESSVYTKCSTADLTGFNMTGLSWSGSANRNQTIPIDKVKSIKIKGYTMQKTTKDNLGVVFYFPYLYDIELIDGNVLTDVVGKVKQIDSFSVTTALGRQKCYTYFVRYWLEDKGEFAHNGSKDYNEKPEVPKEAVIYIEFPDR
ncbi:MAG: hypothetical protein IKQ61_12660 [Spirochaetales bacterium]|jgi:hypothetical protein|nr:hypothetical protein [Spirochaetales bacterium]MBR6201101.1 hypothetical protein [Spirochaetales bacterium]